MHPNVNGARRAGCCSSLALLRLLARGLLLGDPSARPGFGRGPAVRRLLRCWPSRARRRVTGRRRRRERCRQASHGRRRRADGPSGRRAGARPGIGADGCSPTNGHRLHHPARPSSPRSRPFRRLGPGSPLMRIIERRVWRPARPRSSSHVRKWALCRAWHAGCGRPSFVVPAPECPHLRVRHQLAT